MIKQKRGITWLV